MTEEEKFIEDLVLRNGIPSDSSKEFSVLNVYYIPEKHRYYRICRINFDLLDDAVKETTNYIRLNNLNADYVIESLCVHSYSDEQLMWATICFLETFEEAQETILLFLKTRDRNKLKQYEL